MFAGVKLSKLFRGKALQSLKTSLKVFHLLLKVQPDCPSIPDIILSAVHNDKNISFLWCKYALDSLNTH